MGKVISSHEKEKVNRMMDKYLDKFFDEDYKALVEEATKRGQNKYSSNYKKTKKLEKGDYIFSPAGLLRLTKRHDADFFIDSFCSVLDKEYGIADLIRQVNKLSNQLFYMIGVLDDLDILKDKKESILNSTIEFTRLVLSRCDEIVDEANFPD